MPEQRADLMASPRALVPLEEGWEQPPLISRTRAWWWWLNGNVTAEAISRDLAEMRAKGLGGANIIDAGGANQRGHRQVPHGPDFASTEWRRLFTHALREADRQGLELGFNITSGWNLGGPGVPPREAAKRLTWAEVDVEGGRPIELALPTPPNRDGFYEDIATLALPLPPAAEGGPGGALAASSWQPDHPPAHAGDHDESTFWVSGGLRSGEGPTPESPQWLELRFDRPVTANRLLLRGRPEYGPKQCRLEASAGGGQQTLAEFEVGRDGRATLSFDPITSSIFRLVILRSFDPRHPDTPRNAQVREINLLQDDRSLIEAPPGLARVDNFKQKAYYTYPGGFTATEAWHLLDAGTPRPGEVTVKSDEVIELTPHVTADGVLRWNAPEGSWKILRFGYTITGSHVSTHSEGWGGLAIDYLDRSAFVSYWQRVVEPILSEAEPLVGRSLRFLHTDSWELGPVNWTADFPGQFQRLRGYDLQPYLPALAGYIVEDSRTSTRFLNDFRRTLADLIAANKYAAFAEHAHRHGLGIHPESGGPHAAPIDALQCLGLSEIPMGEFWARSNTHRVRDHERLFVKQAASAAHVYGRRLVLAEAFTTIGPQWELAPSDLKPVFDRVACEGLNLTMLHTFDCSPASMGTPGQAYFAGTHINPNVTWWDQAGAFIDYLNRCQFLLQQGLPVADVLYFYGENVPSFVRLKRDDPAGVLPGYDYDVIDAEALLTRTQVDADGRIVLPDGTTYRLLVLPAHDAISLRTMRHIATLVAQGAAVVGRKPQHPMGLTGGAVSEAAFAELTTRLWDDDGAIAEVNARTALQRIGVEVDLLYASATEGAQLDYMHRRTDGADVYFVVNRRAAPVEVEVSFRVVGRQPERSE
ncbi:MAG: glycosyl hydrolase, partial [Phycisphaerales bacterium JB038]